MIIKDLIANRLKVKYKLHDLGVLREILNILI